MKDRRKQPRPDRLFVDSTITGDVEVVTMSTKPGDLGPPITWPAKTIEKVDAVFVEGRQVWGEPAPELLPAEELQREPEPARRLDPVTALGAFVMALCVLAYFFGPLIAGAFA